MKELIKKIKEKKELQNIENKYIIDIVNRVLNQNRKLIKAFQEKRIRSKEYKEVIKKVREKLRLEYGMFSEDLSERDKILTESEKNKTITEKLLKTHKSTKERIKIYPFIYQKIFSITGKPKTILDLGCGMNPVSYPYMKVKAKYYASELNKKDCYFLKKYFKKMKIKGKAFPIDLKKPKLLNKIPKVDVCFLFKVLDTIEKKGHKLAEEIIKTVKAKWIVVSFATQKLGGRPMKHAYRGWLERMLKRLRYEFKIINEKNEIFYIIKIN
jgi:16S rRNA (guanine(1405)-N(7))-methyltransferase